MTEKLIQTIYARRSIRKYTDVPVSEEQIETILKAAMAAPSASDKKPWHFVVVTRREKLDELAERHPYGKMLFQATLCIAVCGDTTISPDYWVQDCSIASTNILLAVTALGLGAVWLGVYPREDRLPAVCEVLGLPEHVIPLNLISIGHPGEEKEARTQYDIERIHRDAW